MTILLNNRGGDSIDTATCEKEYLAPMAICSTDWNWANLSLLSPCRKLAEYRCFGLFIANILRGKHTDDY